MIEKLTVAMILIIQTHNQNYRKEQGSHHFIAFGTNSSENKKLSNGRAIHTRKSNQQQNYANIHVQSDDTHTIKHFHTIILRALGSGLSIDPDRRYIRMK